MRLHTTWFSRSINLERWLLKINGVSYEWNVDYPYRFQKDILQYSVSCYLHFLKKLFVKYIMCMYTMLDLNAIESKDKGSLVYYVLCICKFRYNPKLVWAGSKKETVIC